MRLAFFFLGFVGAALLAREISKTETGQEIMQKIDDVTGGVVSDVVETVSDVAQDVVAPVRTIFGTKYDDLIISSANANGLSPDVLYKLLYQESRFREDIITGRVKSPVGALGIAQFMPATAVQELGSVDAALNPDIAIPGAARYLAKLIRSTGSVSAGVAAYNWGIGNVQRKGLANAPKETQNYVLNITGETLS